MGLLSPAKSVNIGNLIKHSFLLSSHTKVQLLVDVNQYHIQMIQMLTE